MLKLSVLALAATLVAGAAQAQSKDEVWSSEDGVVAVRANKSFEIAVTHAETKKDVYETGRVSGEERPSERERVLSLKTAKGTVWRLKSEADSAELRDPQDRVAARLQK